MVPSITVRDGHSVYGNGTRITVVSGEVQNFTCFIQDTKSLPIIKWVVPNDVTSDVSDQHVMNRSQGDSFFSSRGIIITPAMDDGEKKIICEVYDTKTEALSIWTSLYLDVQCK